MTRRLDGCPRCQGLMVERPCWERDWRAVSTRWGRSIYVWCCVNCGHETDAMMEWNRAQQRETLPCAQHARIWRKVLDAVATQDVA